MGDLVHLESVFDVLDLYLWLSYLFPDTVMVRRMGKELDQSIQTGVTQLVRLLTNTEKGIGTTAAGSVESQIKKNSMHKAVQLYQLRQESEGEPEEMSKSPITERLLSEGRLTTQMLEELKKEWEFRQDASAATSNRSFKMIKNLTKKRKTKL